MNYAAWLWFTLSAKWCLASEKNHMKGLFFPLPPPFSHQVLHFLLVSQRPSILVMSLIKIPVPHSKLSSFATEKCFNVITVITVLKAADLSITPALDNTHIDLKRVVRAAVAARRKCQAEQNVLFWHLWPPFYRQELIKQSDKDVDVGKVASNASAFVLFLWVDWIFQLIIGVELTVEDVSLSIVSSGFAEILNNI